MNHCKHCNRNDLRDLEAAHRCTHGSECRYTTDDAGNVVDWRQLDCNLCTLRCAAERVIAAAVGPVLPRGPDPLLT